MSKSYSDMQDELKLSNKELKDIATNAIKVMKKEFQKTGLLSSLSHSKIDRYVPNNWEGNRKMIYYAAKEFGKDNRWGNHYSLVGTMLIDSLLKELKGKNKFITNIDVPVFRVDNSFFMDVKLSIDVKPLYEMIPIVEIYIEFANDSIMLSDNSTLEIESTWILLSKDVQLMLKEFNIDCVHNGYFRHKEKLYLNFWKNIDDSYYGDEGKKGNFHILADDITILLKKICIIAIFLDKCDQEIWG